MLIAVLALVACLVVAGLLYLYFVVHKKINYWDKRDVLHSTPLPYLGNLAGPESLEALSRKLLEVRPRVNGYFVLVTLSRICVMAFAYFVEYFIKALAELYRDFLIPVHSDKLNLRQINEKMKVYFNIDIFNLQRTSISIHQTQSYDRLDEVSESLIKVKSETG